MSKELFLARLELVVNGFRSAEAPNALKMGCFGTKNPKPTLTLTLNYE